MKLYSCRMATPVGELMLVAQDEGLVAVLWEKEREGRVRLGALVPAPAHPILACAKAELKKYFAGQLKVFSVPLLPIGTEFQRAVWKALREIPFGTTKTYAELALAVGRLKAARAVGAANGRNPLSIVVPCHRVIGANGTLTGFAGGLRAKETLLSLEGASFKQ